jgi:hypothetical protein
MDAKQSPKPPIAVGGWGSPSIPLNRTIRGSINYQYPPDFPEDSRAPIKLEEIRSGREFNDKSKGVTERDLRPMLLVCAMRPALAFAREMIQLRWGADRIDSHVRDFVRGSLAWVKLPTNADFEASAEWHQYQNELLEIAKSQSSPDRNDCVSDHARKIELISEFARSRDEAQAQSEFRVKETKQEFRSAKLRLDDGATTRETIAQLPKQKPRQFREPRPELLAGLESVGKQKAALALGTTTRTIDRWVEAEKLAPIGGGGRTRFRTKDLLKFLNQKKLRQVRQNKTN